ncbi:transaldolase [Uliginosibacterium sp. H1]|uniref:transaldolase n=1 Tax=Uliginosibacterium sp. H1 TaxID=3114757 RepID=UPI002E194CB0|nr:transaldolase [Uliginosibacterium sp. H1]
MSRVSEIARHGQQIWLDSLSRELLASGRLASLIGNDGIAGLTSNPAIFQQAIARDPAYGAALKALPAALSEPEARFEALALPDIRAACDAFTPLYEQSGRDAGYVSFEVSPSLAHDAGGTVAAARRLWGEIARPNLMIKIPATPAGVEAARQCLSEGINVNVTLMFSPQHVLDVFDAYDAGLARRLGGGGDVGQVRAVASVFVSRVDTRLDPLLEKAAPELGGKIAIASAKRAYAEWQRRYQREGEFDQLRAAGAQPPRLLWASTGTKNSAYRDVLYVESLIGPHTVNTVPEATLNAFRDHGEAASRLADGQEEALASLASLQGLGIDLDEHCQTLQQEGLGQFEQAFAALLAQVGGQVS